MTKNNNTQEKNQYGILSMLAMIVGIVIGSGIYAVNNSLYATSNSIGLSMIAWIVISIIVLFMLISFIEISSITVKSGESGTLNNWSRKLLGKNFSKFVGFYFPIVYFPILLSGFSMLASTEFLGNFIDSSSITSGDSKQIWLYFLGSTLLAFLIMNLVFSMNTFTSKPGKIFQQVGTIIKLIPLFALILIGFIALGGVFAGSQNPNHIFDFNNEANQIKDGKSIFTLIILMSPTVMFSFDGFLFAASLQNEAKKPSTYKVAAISGIIFIIFSYIIMSVFAFMYGEPGKYSVSQVMENITGAQWIGIVFSLIIVISIITGFSGITIIINRMIADLSIQNQIKDLNGNLIARNKALVPQKAAIYSWIMTIAVFWVFRMFDVATLIAFDFDKTNSVAFNSFAITGWSLGALTIISYIIYTSIIAGGIKNRFSSNGVEVEKNVAFLPSAFISIFSIVLIVLIYAVSIFTPSSFRIDGVISSYNITTYSFQILALVGIISFIFILPIYFDNQVKKVKKEEMDKKEILIKAYLENKVDPRYI